MECSHTVGPESVCQKEGKQWTRREANKSTRAGADICLGARVNLTKEHLTRHPPHAHLTQLPKVCAPVHTQPRKSHRLPFGDVNHMCESLSTGECAPASRRFALLRRSAHCSRWVCHSSCYLTPPVDTVRTAQCVSDRDRDILLHANKRSSTPPISNP
jgi:hypothetical protein